MVPRMRQFAVLVVTAVVCVACSGSTAAPDPVSSTTFPYVVDPLEPGEGFVELAGNRYPFDDVMCAQGPAADDPEGTSRIFGVYVNFEVDGTTAGVELTRYRSEIHGEIDTVPTVTDVAGVRMQGDDEVIGLEAKRFHIEGERDWRDANDPTATTALITVEGDRYDVDAVFSAVGDDAASATPGVIAARCPAAGPSGDTDDVEGATTSPTG